ncbi:motility protein A [Planobispora longispora]|uniref:Motility protein A n=1 Tax=Planobispora longispora TaxID=28887 RepID=A0A8J3RVS9_9ACTN|nr:MotA/TolQ/ExbB proton channel family protein [Planobispora longispora]BFE89366.1 flagellar motor protein [Planobispora longispora]GIH81036.1 motility protein A [Planobispora longispora]
MDPATLAGIGIAVASMLAMMLLEGADPMSIMLPAPLILVFGGTFGVAMAGGVLRDSLGIGKQIQRAIKSKPVPSNELVDSIVKLAERARREGLLALEDAIKEVEEPFLRRGLELAIDGTDPEELREILEGEVEAKRKADKSGAKIFTDMGGYAPTIGIIGTVISLVLVLENLSDPSKLGHMIGAAFVATLWGVFSANVIWLPIGNRLKRLSELECAQMELTIEGISNIQAGTNPRLVSQKLKSLLPPGEAEDKAAEKKAA